MVIGWLKRIAQPKGEESRPADPAPEATMFEPAPITRPDPVETTIAEAVAADLPREKIAQRAYEIWVSKGRPPGTSHQDWLEAEAQLRAERQAAESLPRRSR